MIGEKVKYRREEIGMSQDTLAKKCGLKNRSSISMIEKNKTDVNQTMLNKISTALGVPPSYFFEYSRREYLLELSQSLTEDEVEAVIKIMEAMK